MLTLHVCFQRIPTALKSEVPGAGALSGSGGGGARVAAGSGAVRPFLSNSGHGRAPARAPEPPTHALHGTPLASPLTSCSVVDELASRDVSGTSASTDSGSCLRQLAQWRRLHSLPFEPDQNKAISISLPDVRRGMTGTHFRGDGSQVEAVHRSSRCKAATGTLFCRGRARVTIGYF